MKKILQIFFAVMLVSSFAFAQTGTGDIYGTVTLADGSAIPGVAISLTGEKMGLQTTVSSEQGHFRFLKLYPGNYELKLELEGFKTVIRKGISIGTGQSVTLNIQMETTTIREEVVITAKPGVIDVRKTTVGVRVDKEMLSTLPTSRNPWTVLNLIPGMMVDREDVGGNESGQQSMFYGHGGDRADNTWNLDGSNITDPSAIGAAPGYLNTNSYEELQVTMGANDITAQTGGTQLNFVTKRAGNRYSGDFHLYVEDQAWEMNQKLPATITDLGLGSPGIFRLYQYGVNLGGPIIKDKLWFFGSWGVQDIHSRTITQQEDATWLVSGYGKLNFQVGNTSGGFQLSYDNKMKWNRAVLGAGSEGPNVARDQSGPGYFFVGNLQHVFGDLMLNAKFAYGDGGFYLFPEKTAGELNASTGHYEGDTCWVYGGWSYLTGSYSYYGTNRNTIDMAIDGNYFLENTLGGDHEIRFGVDYYTADTTSEGKIVNQRRYWAYDYPASVPEEVWFITDGALDLGFKRISFYLSDTATFGKLTANIGIRYDKESGSHNALTLPGLSHPETGELIIQQWLPPVSIAGRTIDANFEVISPRLSLTYDLKGDGKTVIKSAFAIYGGQSGNDIAYHTWEWWNREIDLAWDDKNGNLIPEAGEYSTDLDDILWENINELDPGSAISPDKYDPDLNSPLLREITISVEQALGEDMAISIAGFLKKRYNFNWYRGILEDGSYDSFSNAYIFDTYTFMDGSSKDLYARTEVPVASYLTNHGSGHYNDYKAITVMFKKKLSKGWMLDASISYMDWIAHRDQKEFLGTTDTTYLGNWDFIDGGVVAPEAGGSGLTGVFVNSRWQFKLSGLWQLPWGVNLTGVFQAREGYVIPYYETVYIPSRISWRQVYQAGKNMGDDRLPNFWMLNLGLEKTIKISDTATATIFIDGYNITNNDMTLKVQNNLKSSHYNEVQRILNPGLFQFGVRVSF